MAYTVSTTSGTSVTVADGVVDTTNYSLSLVGKNVSGYGQYFVQNSIRHLENFANSTAPSPTNKLTGQLWYDTSSSQMRVYNGSSWIRLTPGVSASAPADGFQSGTMYFDTTDDKLKIYNGTSFVDTSYAGEVSDAYSSTYGTAGGTKVRNIFLNATSGGPYPVTALVSVNQTESSGDGTGAIPSGETIMAIFSDYEFTAADSVSSSMGDNINWHDQLTAANGVGATIKKGLNLRDEYANTSIALADRAYRADAVTGNIVVGASNVALSAIVQTGGSFVPATDVTYDLGNSTNRFSQTWSQYVNVGNGSNGFIRAYGDLAIGNSTTRVNTFHSTNADINTLTVNTGATVSAPLGVTGVLTASSDLTVAGTTTLNGSTTLGNATSDTVSLGALLSSPIIPDTDVTYSLGNTNNRYSIVYANQFQGDVTGDVTGNCTGSSGSSATVETITGGNNASHYLAFVDGNNGSSTAEIVYTDAGISYNPSTNILTVAGSTASDLTGDVTGSISGGTVAGTSVTASGTVTGATLTDGTASINSGQITGGVTATFSGAVQGGTLTDGTMSISSGVLTGGVTGDFSGDVTAVNFNGVATSAKYADMAEIYSADADYEAGTVVKIGGEAEITQTTEHADADVFGVISTNPAYLMNSEAEGLPVALAGRVPVKVVGKVAKGERLVASDEPGMAWALGSDDYDTRAIIGRSLEDKDDGGIGLVEAVIGVK